MVVEDLCRVALGTVLALIVPAACGNASQKDGDGSSCVVAQHLDRCCATEVAVPRSELAKDPCLVDLLAPIEEAVRDGCAALRGECPSDCIPVTAATRIATRDSRGQCRFTHECQEDADCVLARDPGTCCTCPFGAPKSGLEYSQVENTAASPAMCPTNCSPCPSTEPRATCTGNASGFKVCAPSWPAQHTGECTVEAYCSTGPNERICVSPTETVCRTPAPKDECTSDASCAGTFEPWICVPSGPCGAKRCEMHCFYANCRDYEACGDDGRCVPKRCAGDPECGQFALCSSGGECALRPCTSTAECSPGFCVNGLCQFTFGVCAPKP